LVTKSLANARAFIKGARTCQKIFGPTFFICFSNKRRDLSCV